MRLHNRVLTASAAVAVDHLILTAADSAPATADTEKRQVTGLIIPYGKPGRTSAGLITAKKGSVTVPADISRVKLMNKHRPDGGESVGHMVSIEDREDGIYATFQFGSGPLADAALTAAKEKVRDAFSVELSGHKLAGNTLTASSLDAVALVDVPAFSDARVAAIASQSVGSAPASLLSGIADSTSGLSFRDASRALSGWLAGDSSPEVTAALADITYTAHTFVHQDGWLGELWSGLPFARKFVPLLDTSNALTRMKMTGWRWITRPQVGDYAGDKAQIPTAAVQTEEVPYSAARLAGGHDIDRAHFDFNDMEFIQSYLRAMRDSYARKSDAKAIAHIVSNADAALEVDGVTPTSTAGLIKAAAMAIEAVNNGDKYDQTTLGDDAGLGDGAASYVVVNSIDYMTLLDYTAQNVPAFLEKMLDVDPANFVTSAAVPSGTVIAGVKAATQFRELPGSPIRVSTTNLANGGYDEALFGYWAAFTSDVRAIRSVSFT